MRRILLFSWCCAAAGAPICPQVTPGMAPAWVDIVSNHVNSAGSPGTWFEFSNLERTPRKPGRSLPLTVATPASAIGAYDAHTFPGGPPFYSNSSGASIECLPGLDPSVVVTL